MLNLESLNLGANSLTGPIPPELGNLPILYRLDVSDTTLEGPLPDELVGLYLTYFTWYDTSLCAPDDPVFLSWLRSIAYHDGGETCTAGN